MNDSIIVVDNLSKYFGNVNALDNISFKISRNEYVCVIGSSGAGKTTLLRIIAGLDKPSYGSIYFNNKNLIEQPIHGILQWFFKIMLFSPIWMFSKTLV